jgi:hypothetical protein
MMNRSRGLLAALAALGCMCGALSLYLAVRSNASSPTTGVARQSDRQTAAAGTNDVAQLRHELAGLQAQVWAQERRSPDPARTKAADLPVPGDPRSDPEARAEQQRAHREYMAGIDDAFRREVVDPTWSPATSTVVQEALAGDTDLRSLARSAECRSRTCRVEIADDGSGKLGKLVPALALRLGQVLPSVAGDRVVDAGGAATVILYMSRRDDAQAAAP